MLVKKVDSNWWLVCDVTGQVGFVPSNFLEEIPMFENESWFYCNITREQAETLLSKPPNEIGSFLIRPSESRRNEFSLSESRCSPKGSFYISPQMKFTSLEQLVTYYQEHKTRVSLKLKNPCQTPHKEELPQVSNLKVIDTWEIQRHQIQLQEKLGTGNFGEVYKGLWNKTTEIAVKTLKKGSACEKDFLSEAQVMMKLRHPKLIQLYGVSTKEEPFFIVTEFMKFGSLLKYLKIYGDTSGLLQRLTIVSQVSSGMAYLESQNFIHRDLAARNVLVGKGLMCKVADFGLSRILQGTEYMAIEGTRFPIRWTAPEALLYNRFTIKSDVWSFAVLLSEVFTNGQNPYPDLTNQEVVENISHGYRMSRPQNSPKEIYTIMLECWEDDPSKRPSFEYLKKTLESFCAVLLDR
ncbi:Tyrosine-protein kinase isoform SRK4 [Armadillidium vulgare]|nr:Tyrosine-protein kinase isoform SRK4 [Armadillidium vulgare]